MVLFYVCFVACVCEGLIFPMHCFGYLKRSMATKQLRYCGAGTFARNVSEKIKLLALYEFGYRNDFCNHAYGNCMSALARLVSIVPV